MKKSNIKNSSLVGAIVVLYYPEHQSLIRLLQSLNGQVFKSFVIDNTPDLAVMTENRRAIENEFPEVVYVSFGDNLGIARAHNEGIGLANQAKCDHVILFDQDSEIPSNLVSELLLAEQRLFDEGLSPGAVGPIFKDRKTGELSRAIRHTKWYVDRVEIDCSEKVPVQADYLISSGSLIRISVLEKVGGMREDLFIDWVDVEWGLRASRYGFNHYIIPTTIMEHSIGDAIISFMGRRICLHNDLRNFYIVRNACRLLLDPQIDRGWRVNILFKIPLWISLYSLTSKSKIKSLLRLLLACYQGFFGHLGRYK